MVAKKKRQKYDITKLVEEIDIFDVLDYLGSRYKMLTPGKYGKRATMLCHKHNDKRTGNFIVDSAGYKCFACGAHGDSLDLIMETLDCKRSEGIKILLSIAGKPEYYEDNLTPVILSQRECDLIRLKNGKTLIPSKYTAELPQADSKEGDRELTETDVATVESDNVCYIVHKVADKNPLLTLKQSSEWQYKLLVQRFAEQAIRDNAGWLDGDWDVGIYNAAITRINAIKVLMTRHKIRCSKATEKIVQKSREKLSALKSAS
jgi:hypothetical protein